MSMRRFLDILQEGQKPVVASPAEDFVRQAEKRLRPLSQHVSVGLSAIDAKTVEIIHIGAHTMKAGWGTKAMAILCRLASSRGITLRLEVDHEQDDWSYGHEDDEDEPDNEIVAPSSDKLLDWYGRFGFEFGESGANRTEMIRQP